MITLTTEAITQIRDDKQLFNKIMIALGITERTMYNYLRSNSVELTRVEALNQFVEHTNIALSKIITGGKLSKMLAK